MGRGRLSPTPRSINWKEPIQAYHPVYFDTSGVAPGHLSFGHLTDIHLNGRLDILQQNPVQVIEGAEKEVSPSVEKLIEPTNRSFTRLLDAMASDQEVQALLIGGDLIDHQLNAFVRQPPTTMEGVWSAVDLERQKKGYAAGVDMVSFYTLILAFCRSAKKPVFGVAGNHDCYLQPFGISPRAFDTLRANEGIPADVNLTFYEAALAFGPTWADCEESVPEPGRPSSSFAAEWMEWFYTVFTPFADFSVQLPKQQLVCLGWGDNEDMFFGGQGISHLPRADDAVSEVQLRLLREAAGAHKRRAAVVLAHFTVASFSDDIPLFDAHGKAAVGSLHIQEDKFTMGTFEKRRAELIELLGQRTITCVLTGHSHRRGLYLLGGPLDEDHDGLPESSTRSVTLVDPDRFDFKRVPEKLRIPAIVVSDSGGPYPRYNRAGEFGGWGSDKPSGSVVKFTDDGKLEHVRVVRSGRKQERPRLAVAVDYVDVLHRSVWVVPLQTQYILPSEERTTMRRLKGGEEGEEVFYRLSTKLHPELKRIGLSVASITLHAVGGRLKPLMLEVDGQDVCGLRGQQNLDFYKWLQQAGVPDRFVSVRFNWNGNDAVRRRYKLDAWNAEVRVTSWLLDPYDMNGAHRYMLQRPLRSAGALKHFPEVPDFSWRKRRAPRRKPKSGASLGG